MSTLTAMPPYPWQQALWEDFIAWIERGRLAHALLLAGPEGLGGDALAQAMAGFLLCNAPLGDVACGRCRGCELVSSGSHPDLLRVQPEESAKAIKIDQVRQVAEFVSKTGQQGGRKIVVLAPAEVMNHNAANALLKSLEEPAGATHLLLVSYEPSRLPATIRSRCAKLPLAVPPPQTSLAWLQQVGIPDAQELLQRAGGEPLKVERWFAQDFLAQQQRMGKDLQDLAAGRRSPLEVARAWLEHSGLDVIDSLLVWVHAAIRYRYQNTSPPGVDPGLRALLAGVPLQWLFRYLDKLTLSKKELLSQNNPNLELMLDELLMAWSALCRQR